MADTPSADEIARRVEAMAAAVNASPPFAVGDRVRIHRAATQLDLASDIAIVTGYIPSPVGARVGVVCAIGPGAAPVQTELLAFALEKVS